MVALKCLFASIFLSASANAAVTFCSDSSDHSSDYIASVLALPDGAESRVVPTNLDGLLKSMSASEKGRLLLAAAQLGWIDMVDALIQNKVDVDFKGNLSRDHVDDFQTTALVAAAWCGHESVVNHLLQGGADPELAAHFPFAGREGSINVFSLHAAVVGSEYMGGSVDVLAALIDAGADRVRKDGSGRIAMDYALKLDSISADVKARMIQLLEGSYGQSPQ